MKYIPIFSILLIVNIVPAYALYESPTNEEKTDFDQLLAQFKVVDAPKKDVSDVIGTFQKPMANTFFCNLHDSNNQIITIINTKLAKFDENTTHQDIVTGGSYTWHCSETMQNGKISLYCNNELRINPQVISNDTQVDPQLHNIENLVILYHELLHGQLMIDAIKSSSLWQQETCNLQPGENIDYSFADPDHKIINYLQTQFASALVDKAGGKMITKEISSDETNNGTFTIKVLSFNDYPTFENSSKITFRTNNIFENSFFQVKNDVFFNGHLKDDTRPGIAWFYLFNNEKTQNITNESIPIWIKQATGLWSSGNGQDQYFYSAIDYLVKHNIIRSNNEKITISTVPHWLQKSAHLWFTGEIDDNTFVSSIQYMISSGIIR
ncbi:MAG: hypothetical protein KGI02_01200 [Thaumarchaeota archaeon]|nr:hypothetical protein [Nitrososphaerota archaeon]MDE1830964.1 hypothetical protein [Nitrososphaerota archaeon]MDE1841099.1 hypothetical protein [Nitrososphaerota archaeon]